MKQIFLGQIKGGKPILQKPEVWRETILKIPEGSYIEMTIKKVRSTRSRQQRGYYWGVIIPALCLKLGLDKDEMNEALKDMFNSKLIKVGTEEIKIGMSIENEPTNEVELIYTAIRNWASADPNVATYIALPNETDWLKWY